MSSSEKESTNSSDIKLRPDGWKRFERAIDAAVKSGPKHKIGKRKAKTGAKASPPKKRG